MLSLRCWGTRGNLATPQAEMLELGGNTSCYEVGLSEDQSLVLDCGTGIIEYAGAVMPRALASPCEFHILVSHFHWDHILGFPFFHPIHVPGTQVHLYSAFDVGVLEEHFRNLFDGTYSPLRDLNNLAADLTFHQIPAEGTDILGARVRCCAVDNSEEAFAARIDSDGRSLCYVTAHEARDNEHNTRVVEFVRGADLLVHDAQFTAGEYPQHEGWGHSSIEAALRNAEAAGVARVLLSNHDPGHTDRFLQDYVAGLPAPRNGLVVGLAAEGPTIQV